MMLEELLRSLSKIPRPVSGAFFAARTTAMAASAPRKRRGSLLLAVYWLLVAFFAGSILMQSWSGLALVVSCGFALAFPALALRLVLRLASPLIR